MDRLLNSLYFLDNSNAWVPGHGSAFWLISDIPCNKLGYENYAIYAKGGGHAVI